MVLSIGVLTLPGCGGRGRRQPEVVDGLQQIENALSFNNITLEQATESGEITWKIFAERAVYADEQGYAGVQNPDGELYQDGEAIYQVKSKLGEVYEDGNRIILRDTVEVTDLRNNAVLQGDFMEWKPDEGVLLLRGNLRGTHPQLLVTAQEGRLFDAEQRLDLTGRVVANTVGNPRLNLRTEALSWLIEGQRVQSDRPTQLRRFQQGQVTDLAVGKQAEVNLETSLAILKEEAQLAMSAQGMQVNGTEIFWEIPQERVRSNQPLSIIQPRQRMVVTANQGVMNLQTRIVDLQGSVRLVAQLNGAVLISDRLNWNIDTQDLRADGNVNYQQANPPLVSTGPRAIGRLQNQTLVMTGGRITSEFIPE